MTLVQSNPRYNCAYPISVAVFPISYVFAQNADV